MLSLLILLILLITNLIINLYLPEVPLLLNIISICTLLIWVIQTYREHRSYFFLQFYAFFAFCTPILISFFLEYEVYLTEIRQITYASGLPTKAALQCFLFFLGSRAIFSYFNASKGSIRIPNIDKKSYEYIRFLLRLFVILMILFLSVIILIYGTPEGIHRQIYWSQHAIPWGGTVVYALVQFTFVLGVLYNQSKNKIDILLFLVTLVVINSLGVRFTGIVVSIIFFLTPNIIFLNKELKLVNKKRTIIILLAIVVTSLAIKNGFQSFDNHTSSERIITRASLQPQMWWALDQISSVSPKPIDDILQHYLGIGAEAKEKGLYYLMYKIAPFDVVENRFNAGGGFTTGGVFNNVYFFGYILGGIVNFIQGTIFGASLFILYITLFSNNLLFMLIAFRLSFKLQNIFLSGTTPNLFSVEIWGYIIALFIIISLKSGLTTTIKTKRNH